MTPSKQRQTVGIRSYYPKEKHAEELFRLLNDRRHEPILLTGEIGAKERKAILNSLPGFEHEHRIIVATESLLSEGFDLSYLDTLFIATPISWDGSVTQQVGRLHRSHEGKQQVEIFDYIDLSIPMLARMYQKRLKTTPSWGTKFIQQRTVSNPITTSS